VRDAGWRLVYRLGFPAARLWWRVRRPQHVGAQVAVHVGGALLLIRLSYRREWTLPGGGVHAGETPLAAARRELAEETGLVADWLLPAGTVHGAWDGRSEVVHFFELPLDHLPPLALDRREVIAARLVPLAELGGLRLTGSVAGYVAAHRKRAARPPGPAPA
jgi:8-oxo-dGTP pyrophosphatase MutT (NUDIX family)